MPVHFKSKTEYSRQFAPHQSQSIDVQMGTQAAGIGNEHLAVSYEPPIQHKKRLDGPPTSLSTNFYQNSTRKAEFTLLGQQDKFSDNVQYQPKGPKSQPKIYKNKENLDDEAPPNKQLRMQKRIKPLLKERHPPIPLSMPRKSVEASQDMDVVASPPMAPRVEKLHPSDGEVKDAMKDKDLKDILGDSLQKEQHAKTVSKRAVSKKKEELVSDGKEDNSNKVNVMNEGVQTNMKKGVALSAPEAPAAYALKYKAGIAPPRPVKKFSEYQKQFQWKHGRKASPLLAAEQIVYTSNTELGPYKNEAIPKVSEYKREFQPWKPLDVGASLNLNQNKNIENDNKKKAVVKRSKSAAADLRKERKDDSFDKDDGPVELKEKLKKTHGKMRRLGSEYQANFKAPTAYYNTKGAWKGADPPQLMPPSDKNLTDEKVTNETDSVPMSNWFAEVVELRRRAQEYRKRAQGTHFSREHLVQLMARQNECWDINSQASSTVRALNLETPKMSDRSCSDSPIFSDDVEVEDLEQEELEEAHHVKGNKKMEASPAERRMKRLKGDKDAVVTQQRKLKEKAKKEEEVDMGENSDCGDDVKSDEGRQPTPKLKQTKTSSSRHHLDLTTPAVGGALLTCPPSKNSKIIVTSRSGDSYVTASDNMEVSPAQRKIDMEKLKTRPLLGQPSGDTHALRDDDASIDKALNTHYVPTPLVDVGSDEDKENAPSTKEETKAVKKTKTAKPSRLTPVQEGAGKTYIKPKEFLTLDDIRANQENNGAVDDEVMSVSMMSVASSASLASEVLERARKRKEFWDNRGTEKC